MDTRIFSSTKGHVAAEQYEHCQLLSVSLNELPIQSLVKKLSSETSRWRICFVLKYFSFSQLPMNPCIKYKTKLERPPNLPPVTTKSVKFNDIPQVFEYPLLNEEKFFKVHGYHPHLAKYCVDPMASLLQNLKRWIWFY